MYPEIRLKKGREASLLSRHPWLYSGALEAVPEEVAHGDLVRLISSDDRVMAVGTYSSRSMIAVRILDFRDAQIDRAWLAAHIDQAHRRRLLLGIGDNSETTGYRVVFGESDSLPGLVVDRYADILVVQFSTLGMERLRQEVISALVDLFHPASIYEKSELPSRIEEGLPPAAGPCYGDAPDLVEFRENGRRHLADLRNGQKTGFYLDQRDLRQEIHRLAAGRRALDLFSYTGSCGLAALAGGALSVHCVDSSAAALDIGLQQACLGGLDRSCLTCETADVFQWLASRTSPEYDLVMVDPPALIKSRRHADAGRRGYHFLNRAALRLLNDGGILVTSSCSSFFTEEDLAITLRRASEQVGVELIILKIIRPGPDHPMSLYFPEGSYLKSFVCLVRH